MKDEAQAIIDSGKSSELQNEAAKQLLSRLTDAENAILEQSHEFMSYRLERLVYKWFAAAYPKGEDERVMLRVLYGSSPDLSLAIKHSIRRNFNRVVGKERHCFVEIPLV